MSSGIKQRDFGFGLHLGEKTGLFTSLPRSQSTCLKQVETNRQGKWQPCQPDLELRQRFIHYRQLLAVCWQFVCISFAKWCRKMQNHVSLQIYIVFWVQQSTNPRWVLFHWFITNAAAKAWFEVLQQAAKIRCSERASRDSEIHGSNSGFQDRKSSLVYSSAKKTLPSNFCV